MNEDGREINIDKQSSLTALLIIFIAISIIEGYFLITISRSDENKEPSQNSSALQTPTPTFITNAPSPVSDKLVPKKAPLNKQYVFPINNQEGSSAIEVNFNIADYEFTKDLFVNFQKATITNDKIILQFNIEITNDSNLAFQILTRDYLRLSVNGKDKWRAPDYHDDPVEVRPNSTKEATVGFKLDETDKDIRIQVGEPDNPKEIIEIK